MTEWVRDEAELVRRCREGSDAAYAVLVREHRPRLFALAYRLTGDRATAEDVVQEAFLAAFKAIDRFELKPSLAAWLNTITVRIARRAGARARSRPDMSLSAIQGDRDPLPSAPGFADLGVDGNPVAAAESAELRAQVSAAIERLPFNYRAAVALRFLTGLDYVAAAEAMDVPLNTFKSHLLRGTRMLRADLARHLEPTQGRDTPRRDANGRDGHGPDTPVLDVLGLDRPITPTTAPDPTPGISAQIPSRGLPTPAPTSTRRS